jgi:hypothetical protein
MGGRSPPRAAARGMALHILGDFLHCRPVNKACRIEFLD